MAFRKPKKQPQFADLIGILAQSKETENPIYQTIQEIINRLSQFQQVTLESVADINNSISTSKTVLNVAADKKATYHTRADETINLPNSVQLLAGVGITFDDTVANKRTINAPSTGSGYWTPLTDGDLDETDLIFANGECIAVFVPVI